MLNCCWYSAITSSIPPRIFRYYIIACQPVRVPNMCLGTNVSGHKHIRVGTIVSGPKRVWAQSCLGTNVSGHNRVWAQSCLGTIVSGHIVSGHNRVGSSMYGHNRVVSSRNSLVSLIIVWHYISFC